MERRGEETGIGGIGGAGARGTYVRCESEAYEWDWEREWEWVDRERVCWERGSCEWDIDLERDISDPLESIVLLLCGPIPSPPGLIVLPLDRDLCGWERGEGDGAGEGAAEGAAKGLEYWRLCALVWDTQFETRFWLLR